MFGHGHTNALLRDMPTCNANTTSEFHLNLQCHWKWVSNKDSLSLYSYIIRMKDYERERRLMERQHKLEKQGLAA